MNDYSYWSPFLSVILKREKRKKKKENVSNSITICTYVKKERMTKPLIIVFYDMRTYQLLILDIEPIMNKEKEV
jgi:hypothetical protein